MDIEKIIREKHFGDNEQLEFIFSNDKKIVVVAPAGCGKTTAMVSKIARELSVGNIASNKKVLAMTFSVNGAMKIKDSLKTLLPNLVSNSEHYLKKVDIANYHNFAMKILFKHGYCLNPEFIYLSDFRITDDKNQLLNHYLTRSDSDKLLNLDNAVKQSNNIDLSNLINDYWKVLNDKLIKNHVITYNGILVAAIKLLGKEEVSFFYKNYYQLLIIDEFQDTNLLGYMLIRNLIGDNMAIFLGDEIQKIYGFLGAVDGIFEILSKNYTVKEIEFHNNYRFQKNERMKNLDTFIRSYANNYRYTGKNAKLLINCFLSDNQEDTFIADGIEKIVTNSDDKVAVLVRAGAQGSSIADTLDKRGISYFNALYRDTDLEYIRFYDIAVEEFYNATIDSEKAVQKSLKRCLEQVKARQNEIYSTPNRKFVFDSMYQLLEVLFEQSKKWEGTSKDRYDNIIFTLGNAGLKHMMEFIPEKVVLTTIHSSKGLEWEYVIIPRLNSYSFPSGYMCKPCQQAYSCNRGSKYCQFTFGDSMEEKFQEEISVFYVALTRAKKDVFITTNTGLNSNGYDKQVSCLAYLEGLTIENYNWTIWE